MLYHGTQKVKTSIDMVAYRLSLGKGELPQEQAALGEDHSEKPKKKPIFKMVKVNAQTKQPYTNEDFFSGVPFAMLKKIVGYEPIKGQASQEEKKPQKNQPQKKTTKIRSWLGMVFFALKIGNPCAIQKAFFEKREATGWPMGYEAWVERWQQSLLDDHLLEIYGSEEESEGEDDDETLWL